MKRIFVGMTVLVVFGAIALFGAETAVRFDPGKDLVSLHYDHAPDRDDGQSAAADRTILETLFGAEWLPEHVVAVSGAYGKKNAAAFNPQSDAVMDGVWNGRGGWISAHEDRSAAVSELVRRWGDVLDAGGDVWVKEGGQSDLTAAVVREIRKKRPGLDTTRRIHVVQHSPWNEQQTTEADLAYVKKNTDYVRIRDANAYLNRARGNEAFAAAARSHPVFGPAWRAAFEYYDPSIRLDFSDTGELMRILGMEPFGPDEFAARFLGAGGPRGEIAGKER